MADLFAGEAMSRGDKIGALRREIAMREQVYPRAVAAGKMTEDEAGRQIRVMKEILADYVGPPLL